MNHKSLIVLALCLTSSFASARGVDSSGGANPFVQSVQTLQPLGATFKAAEANLKAQGYEEQGETEVRFQPSKSPGVDIFEIRQSFTQPNCADCKAVVIEVQGQLRNTPPPAGEKDIFKVDTVKILN